MKNWYIVAPIVILFALAVWGTYNLYQKQVAKQVTLEQSPLPTPITGFPQVSSPTPSTLGTQPTTGVPGSQPATGQEIETGILVTSPQEFTKVASPLTISGWTKIPKNHVVIAIKDENGNVLGQKTTDTCSSYQVCPFETSLSFADSPTTTGSIEISGIIIPVTFTQL